MSGKHIQQLLEKEMNRKEFIKYMGSMLLGVFGVHSFLSHLFQQSQAALNDQSTAPQPADERSGFGTRKFGV